MPTGSSSIHFPIQADSAYSLEPDNSYFMVKLQEAQAFFQAGWLEKPSSLIFSSEIESTFHPDKTIKSLYNISALQKNTPCRLGLGFNLTDWMPARSPDTLHISIKYIVVKDAPLRELLDLSGKLNLNATLCIARPDLAVAIKVTEIAGRLLSFYLQEGKSQEIFQLRLDLNLATMKTGSYVVIGSYNDEEWPEKLALNSNGNGPQVYLADDQGNRLDRYSYAVMQVLALKRRGEEKLRGEAWWDLLQSGKEQAINTCLDSDRERQKAWGEWRLILTQVRRLAGKDTSCLLKEIDDIIRKAQLEVQDALSLSTKPEAYGKGEFPRIWQDLLSASTEDELHSYVVDYNESLELSKQILNQYKNIYNI